jgi:hypothetical protein
MISMALVPAGGPVSVTLARFGLSTFAGSCPGLISMLVPCSRDEGVPVIVLSPLTKMSLGLAPSTQ